MEIIRTLEPSTASDVSMFLNNEMTSRLSPDVSNYAKDRMRVWLGHECPLSMNQGFKQAPCPKRLWDWLDKVWGASGMTGNLDAGLAIHGDVGIDLHRDATYAARNALMLNFGDVTWQFDHDRGVSDPEHYTLHQGEIVKFDCKHRHGAYDPAGDRWSIVLWTISHRRRDEFQDYLNGIHPVNRAAF